MEPVTSNYEDTLRSMRTGKNDGSPLNNLRRYMTWGREGESLPYSSDKSPASESSFMSWPAWTSSTSTQAPFYDTFGLTLMQRYAAFGLCILGALLLFMLAFMHMPLVLLRPSKFVVPYCLGNMLLFVSFGFLHGFASYIKHLFKSDRWPFTVAFLGSTSCTLYVAMARMYALTIPMSILQFAVLVAFVISYIPGGASGLSMFGSFATSSIRSRMTGY